MHMPIINITIPSLGEGVTDVNIIRWLVGEGDKVSTDEAVAEIATDKVDAEVFSPTEGKLSKIVRQEGEVVAVGETIALFETDQVPEGIDSPQNESRAFENQLEKFNTKEKAVSGTNAQKDGPDGTITIRKHRYIAPFIRNLAQEYGISIDELYTLRGSGKDNEVIKEDLKDYILQKKLADHESQGKSKTVFKPLPKNQKPFLIESSLIENSEVIEMDRMRKLIAEHMVRSKSISPHVTSFIEADVTSLVTWRNSVKKAFLEETGEKLTFTPIFVEAVVKALKAFPLVNASVDENHIYLKKDINVGVATALTDGNLIVPVIKNADQKNLVGLAREVNDIVVRARQNKLTPGEVKGGTFTITNLGNFDSLAGTPIINQPEVAILAIGAIMRKPAVVKINNMETIGIRDIVMLSLAYDHRIIDGSLGGMFLKYIKNTLQDFNINRQLAT
jgi:2-oxoglutarate dehydrogenase E2 component (dihydrolipoamide succinyltransferase)